jgi:hypothetical protein
LFIFECLETSTLYSCFYEGQEPKKEEEETRVGSHGKTVVSESKLGAKIHGSEVGATDLGSKVKATNLGSEVGAKICGSNLRAKIYGSEVPIRSVPPRMLCMAKHFRAKICDTEMCYLGAMISGADPKVQRSVYVI